VNAPSLSTADRPWRFGLVPRAGVIAAVSIVETLLLSYLIQNAPALAPTGLAAVVHDIQHWLFRFVIAYAASFAMLVYLRGGEYLATLSATAANAPVRIRWWLVHALLLMPLALLSAALYGDLLKLPFLALALAWHACLIAAGMALIAAMAPLPVWAKAARQTASLLLYALLPAAAAVLAIKGSQLLWAPAAELTFHIVQVLLRPFCPTLHADPATLTLATDRFAVMVSEVCSGLEGVGLMLAFCTAWLWYFRREYYFPRALVIVPAAILLVFLLNAVRIAALVLIGDAGYARIASVGFHSQAGWIAFNLAAFAVAIVARRSSWLNRNARLLGARSENTVAAYLMPLLTILAVGMLVRALSAGFDVLYPLRFIGCVAMLWAYRRSYAALDWRFSWRGLVVGGGVFCVWAVFAHFLTAASPTPETLLHMSAPARFGWIGCRVAAAVVTVPIAEELAYRGYLARRLVRANFAAVAFRDIGLPALGLSSLAFGITHGVLWFPGILAGLAYGMLAIRTGRIGESVAAHAATNGLLAAYVLLFNQGQLW
jgi:exosortase E/protease (VPEID-CTERM system)